MGEENQCNGIYLIGSEPVYVPKINYDVLKDAWNKLAEYAREREYFKEDITMPGIKSFHQVTTNSKRGLDRVTSILETDKGTYTCSCEPELNDFETGFAICVAKAALGGEDAYRKMMRSYRNAERDKEKRAAEEEKQRQEQEDLEARRKSRRERKRLSRLVKRKMLEMKAEEIAYEKMTGAKV